MNISTDFKQIPPDFEQAPGGYEWWYFDGMDSQSNISYVIIFYRNNPFSPRYIKNLQSFEKPKRIFPAISISVYEGDEPIYYSFLEYGPGDFKWKESEESIQLCIGDDYVKYVLGEPDKIKFELNINQKLDSGFELILNLKGEGRLSAPDLLNNQQDENHLWNLISPKHKVNGSLVISSKKNKTGSWSFSGTGYHDHNRGDEPMKNNFRDWYWGRFHFEGFTLVYYLMQKHDQKQFEGWLIDDQNGSLEQAFSDANLNEFGKSIFGLHSALNIELESSQVIVNIDNVRKIDNGPFYQRFLGNSIINYNGQAVGAQGISEYIYPNNIYKKLFWPLVNMRLQYKDEKAHWVQKSPLMYPWTWK